MGNTKTKTYPRLENEMCCPECGNENYSYREEPSLRKVNDIYAVYNVYLCKNGHSYYKIQRVYYTDIFTKEYYDNYYMRTHLKEERSSRNNIFSEKDIIRPTSFTATIL